MKVISSGLQSFGYKCLAYMIEWHTSEGDKFWYVRLTILYNTQDLLKNCFYQASPSDFYRCE